MKSGQVWIKTCPEFEFYFGGFSRHMNASFKLPKQLEPHRQS